jgi:uncharacterized protein YdhG (YjbR/CyaY superfamily)
MPLFSNNSKGFSKAERDAMKERANELKAEERATRNRAEAERQVLAKIDKMPEPDRSIGKRIHEIVTANAPSLMPKLMYGMPAYDRNGKTVCLFQSAQKYNTRYSTLGFEGEAALDNGQMWPVAYAIKTLTAEDEMRIAALVKQAVG